MTPEEVAAKAMKGKKEIQFPSVKCGVGAALLLRDQALIVEGGDPTAKKKRKKDSAVDQTLKAMKGAHHLLK